MTRPPTFALGIYERDGRTYKKFRRNLSLCVRIIPGLKEETTPRSDGASTEEKVIMGNSRIFEKWVTKTIYREIHKNMCFTHRK